jgi:hypothetical protein
MSKKRCYYCGISAQDTKLTKEHAPPKALFGYLPNGTDVRLITTDSCWKHNNIKGADDHAMLKAFYIGMHNNQSQGTLIDPTGSISLWLAGTKTVMKYAKKLTQAQDLLLTDSGLLTTEKVSHTYVNEQQWIRMLTAALLSGLCERRLESADYANAKVIAWDTIAQDRSVPLTIARKKQHAEERLRRYELLRPPAWLQPKYGRHGRLPAERYTYSLWIYPDRLLIEHAFFSSYVYWCSVQLDAADSVWFTRQYKSWQSRKVGT